MCTKLVDACDLKADGDNDPYKGCVADLKPWLAEAPPENVESLLTCVESAPGCGKVQGCIAGAGLKSLLGELQGLFEGFGEALGIPKRAPKDP